MSTGTGGGLNTEGQLGMHDVPIMDDETYLLALTWWEADSTYRKAMADGDIRKKEKAKNDAKEAIMSKLELSSDDVTKFRIMKEDDGRNPGEPFMMIVDAKPPAEPTSISFTRTPKHQLSINFEDKANG